MAIDFARNDPERQRLDLVGQLADSFWQRAHDNDREGTFGYAQFAELRASGFTGWTVPQEYGGLGISVYELVLYLERLAQGDGAIALGIGWHLGVVQDLAAKRPWAEAVLEPFLRDAAAGALTNRCSTERATGSPSRGGKMQTTAALAPDGSGDYILNGRKTFTTLSPVLSKAIVTTTLAEDGTGADFLIPLPSTGASIDPVWDMVGMRGTGSHDLVLDNVRVPADHLVHRASDQDRPTSSPYLLFIPAVYLGIALAARREALRFAAAYQPNTLDKPIIHTPNVGQLIGEIELELSAARHYMYGVAARWEQSGDYSAKWSPEFGAVKVFGIRTALSVVDKALRIAGAHGLAMSHPLQRLYRDVRFGLSNPPMEDSALRMLHQKVVREMTERE